MAAGWKAHAHAHAHATWSIILINTRTGEVALGGTATFTGIGEAFRVEPGVMMRDAQGLPELATIAVFFKNLQL